jgi:hypothetical protein
VKILKTLVDKFSQELKYDPFEQVLIGEKKAKKHKK